MSTISEVIEKARTAQIHARIAEQKAQEANEDLERTIETAEQRVRKITLTKKHAAQLAGCDYTTLYRHEQAGKLKSLLITDVLDWIEEYKPGRE